MQPAKYTEEFRRETADYIIPSGRPVIKCCKELGPDPIYLFESSATTKSGTKLQDNPSSAHGQHKSLQLEAGASSLTWLTPRYLYLNIYLVVLTSENSLFTVSTTKS